MLTRAYGAVIVSRTTVVCLKQQRCCLRTKTSRSNLSSFVPSYTIAVDVRLANNIGMLLSPCIPCYRMVPVLLNVTNSDCNNVCLDHINSKMTMYYKCIITATEFF